MVTKHPDIERATHWLTTDLRALRDSIKPFAQPCQQTSLVTIAVIFLLLDLPPAERAKAVAMLREGLL